MEFFWQYLPKCFFKRAKSFQHSISKHTSFLWKTEIVSICHKKYFRKTKEIGLDY